ncbi:MAG: PAS domain-containing sensor histidine kinase [Alphaproteobacteria bacterium]|nr:PAS domain-containing sensor histidine kinase [Alphaproteobacteria bacterium]
MPTVDRHLAYGLALLTPMLGIATYLALNRTWPFDESGWSARAIVIADLVLLLVLGWTVLQRVIRLWRERRRGAAGSRLHLRLAALLAVMAMAPTAVLAVFAFLFIIQGVQAWFADSVTTALDESKRVAQAYVEDHRKTIAADAVAVAQAIGDDPNFLQRPFVVRNQLLSGYADLRKLAEAIIVTGDYRIVARTAIAFSLDSTPPDSATINRARNGDVVFLRSGEDRAHALVRIDGHDNSFLLVGRYLDPTVLAYLDRLDRAQKQYSERQGGLLGIQINFGIVFLVIALLLLFVAVWLGLLIADRLVHPISGLVRATERLSTGDLTARVTEGRSEDEFGTLSRAFNRMADELEGQRDRLIEANRQIDLRRQFTEAVLAGVSSGVIGLDQFGAINLPNRRAIELLDIPAQEVMGKPLVELIPEMAELFAVVQSRDGRLVEDEIDLERRNQNRRLLVRIVGERTGDHINGYVVTFDDISDLVAAQRRAAWADIARRIAHEIKNPLTPIRLSAERLRRKYLGEITTTPEVFSQCTDTIVRQVEDIRRMVDEFSNFARMPAPEFREEDVVAIAKDAMFAEQVAHPTITYLSDWPSYPARLVCDRRQMGQAISNMLINAAQALEEWEQPVRRFQVALAILVRDGILDIIVEDSGPGFPQEERSRLTEPYVTTRSKGTGLGLAIVRRIVEEHGGQLTLEDRAGGGACVRLTFDASTVADRHASHARAAE